MTSGPPSWLPSTILKRHVAVAPSSLDVETRSVSCIISTGAPVIRFYGTEVLEISRAAIDTSRVISGLCPVLDSHQANSISTALGIVTETWIKSRALWGRLQLNETAQGDLAFGMIRRGELNGVSAGYRVTRWRVENEAGETIDAEDTYWSDGDSFTYIAERWELLECSCVTIAADSGAGIRDEPSTNANSIEDIRARMGARQRMTERMSQLLKGTVRL
jgi:phage head maturation protease